MTPKQNKQTGMWGRFLALFSATQKISDIDRRIDMVKNQPDPQILKHIIMTDPVTSVRLEALKHINDIKILNELLAGNLDATMRALVNKQVKKHQVSDKNHSPGDDSNSSVVTSAPYSVNPDDERSLSELARTYKEKLDDMSLMRVLDNTYDIKVIEKAKQYFTKKDQIVNLLEKRIASLKEQQIESINDEVHLFEMYQSEKDRSIRSRILNKLKNPTFLDAIVKSETDQRLIERATILLLTYGKDLNERQYVKKLIQNSASRKTFRRLLKVISDESLKTEINIIIGRKEQQNIPVAQRQVEVQQILDESLTETDKLIARFSERVKQGRKENLYFGDVKTIDELIAEKNMSNKQESYASQEDDDPAISFHAIDSDTMDTPHEFYKKYHRHVDSSYNSEFELFKSICNSRRTTSSDLLRLRELLWYVDKVNTEPIKDEIICEIRKIGESIDSQNGLEKMQLAHETLNSLGTKDPDRLGYLWNGIGEWHW